MNVFSFIKSNLHSIVGTLSIIGIIIIWWAICFFGLIPPKFLVSPWKIVEEFVLLLKEGYANIPLHDHFLASMARTFTGFALGSSLAIPVGIIIGYNKYIRSAAVPILSFLRPIPGIALIPLFILWFGIGELSKIILITYASFLYVSVNTTAGVRNVPINLIRAAQTLGAKEKDILFKVILPESLPTIITGVKIGALISWTLVVAAELIAARSGLGFLIMDAATFYRVPDVYVGIFLVGLIGVALENIIKILENRVVHWSGKT